MLILPISGSMTTVTWISYTDFDVPFEVWRTAFQGIGVVSEVWRIRSLLRVFLAFPVLPRVDCQCALPPRLARVHLLAPRMLTHLQAPARQEVWRRRRSRRE